MKFIWSNTTRRNRDLKFHKAKSLTRLLQFTIPYLSKIILAAACVILVNIAQLLKPYILKLIIDDFLINKSVQSGIHSINAMAFLYFVIVLLGGVLTFAQVNLINRVGQDIMKTLRNKVFKTIQLLPLSYLDKNSSGRLITRATNDVEALSEMYTDVIINLFKDVFLLIGIVYAMVTLNLKLALISFSVVPVMFFIVFLLKKKIKDNFTNMKSLIGRINGFMAESISGMKVIQIFQGEKEKKQQFLKLNGDYFDTTLFQVRLNSILRPAADIFQSLAVAIIIWYGMGKIAGKTLEIGVLYAFTTYIKQFFAPISDLADNYTTIQSALVSADRIFELLDEENNLEDLDKGLNINKIEGNIEFRHVWFSYNNKDWVLKDISFKLNKGEMAAFVGETGSGKTTIINLISGFYDIQRGEILIDGVNIKDISKKDLRRNISVVLQDVFLFSGNIRMNVTLNDNIDDKVINEALKTSYALGFVNSLGQGLDHPVMERGSTFSSGQKQLLAFARALAHKPSIFVLDEATANIDTHTEKLIQKAIDNVIINTTTIVIAHRLSTIRNADKIIVLKNGSIVEMGNHNELVTQNGYYKKLLEEGLEENIQEYLA
ncbi:ABC transporter ATP-binding protein [Clostridium manihotivorum]|uniref:ABC transporter ATP-binding protein n=1 Tax=Clostridium manihotivorum TaxID=2320868 RepID=A0A3R5QSF5_9CLOT|nr:ABC transporter ATP-binding protein [Clostridium manihotivorum]QAA31587.1 ABC transporter ATP-binding protein [Clostridium manihotivorum]